MQLAESVAYWSVAQRLACLLLDLADQFGHPSLDGSTIVNRAFTQEQLAQMVGATRKATGEELRALRTAGIV